MAKRELAAASKESKRRWMQRWRATHKEERNRKERERYAQNKSAIQTRQRDRRYRRVFGITEKTYFELFQFQNGVCAICGDPPKSSRLHVDHNHETGKIRGLLCYKCNYAIGLLNDSPEKATKLAAYLSSPPAGQVLDSDT